MAARRVILPPPPTKAEAAKVAQRQAAMRGRIGVNLKAARTRSGLSLRALEARSNISANYLSGLERGLHAATVDVLVQVAFYLDTTVADLISE